MKITGVESIALSYIPENPPIDGLSGIASRDVFLVRVLTDAGVTGLGEGFALGSLRSLAATVEETLAPLILGHDPRDISRLWDRMYHFTFRYGRRGLVLPGISALDMALWDILGKVAGLPVYKLGGGCRDAVPAYASGGYYFADKGMDRLLAEANGYRERGFSRMKMKIGGASRDEDVRRIGEVRRTLGEKMELAVDANNAYDFNQALTIGRFLDDVGIAFFEEPISSDHPDASAELARSLDTPVAGYETEVTSFGMREFIVHRAVDIVQADAIWSGGITDCLRTSALARAWGMEVIPHFSAAAVSLAANLHWAAMVPNCSWIELTQDANPLRDELAREPIRCEKGRLLLPDRPGLGVELDDNVVKKYRVR
ncbi:MAG: mandelate racemase/muconate lactonizing enzyme family protein [Planctomycetota bacterium]|jgi:L-alanine-DL-glutamate epimerase-like enolase superfamily enzyme|nr:mandelate racemase/muconate lactonizing enzyme family protein [Planctomycetota bacterium]